MPSATGPCRDIRANMERTWLRKGLDHCGPGTCAMAGQNPGVRAVADHGRQRYKSGGRQERQVRKWPARSVIAAGSALDLAGCAKP